MMALRPSIEFPLSIRRSRYEKRSRLRAIEAEGRFAFGLGRMSRRESDPPPFPVFVGHRRRVVPPTTGASHRPFERRIARAARRRLSSLHLASERSAGFAIRRSRRSFRIGRFGSDGRRGYSLDGSRVARALFYLPCSEDPRFASANEGAGRAEGKDESFRFESRGDRSAAILSRRLGSPGHSMGLEFIDIPYRNIHRDDIGTG